MTVCLEWHRQGGQWLRNTWPQGHMGAPGMVGGDPRLQQTSQVARTQWDEEVHACLPERAHAPLTPCVGLGTLGGRCEAPKSTGGYVLVELWGDNAIAVMQAATIAVVRWYSFA